MAARGWRRSGGRMVRSGGGVATLDPPRAGGFDPVAQGLPPEDDPEIQSRFEDIRGRDDETLNFLARNLGIPPDDDREAKVKKIAYHVLEFEPIFGSSRVSKREKELLMSSKDVKDFSKQDRARLNAMRNGYNTREEFLNASPREHEGRGGKRVTIFESKNLRMGVMSDGYTSWTNNDSHFRSDKKASKAELKEMKRAWREYVNSPAGKRRFEAVTATGDGAGDSRYRIYKRAGFQGSMYGKLVFDNR